jgi:hypothetical protein
MAHNLQAQTILYNTSSPASLSFQNTRELILTDPQHSVYLQTKKRGHLSK